MTELTFNKQNLYLYICISIYVLGELHDKREHVCKFVPSYNDEVE